MSNTGKRSLALHKKHKGKLEIKSKVALNSKDDLSLAYTPGVAEVSLQIAKNPAKAFDYTIKSNTVAIVTDGSAVLGLGNIGPLAALPVMEGKAVLFKEFSGLDAFPICLDTQDPEKIIETVKNIAPAFGAIQLEDIASPKCFEIERRLKQELNIPVMHDDQHGTAVVVLAGLINALKIKSAFAVRLRQDYVGQEASVNGHLPNKLMMAKIIVNGAGAAGVAITKLLLLYGFRNIIVLDSQGTIFNGRKKLSPEKQRLAEHTNTKKLAGDLGAALKGADIFVGVSKAGILKPEMVKQMNRQPIIFALANPIPEIMPQAAKKAGAFIVATGRSDFENQVNNVLTFPGIFLGALQNKVKQITEKMLLQAAINLSKTVKRPTPSKILPDVFDKSVVRRVAKAIR